MTVASFQKFVQMPAGLRNESALIAACRAGGVGVVNGELCSDSRLVVDEMARVAAKVRSPFGVRVDVVDELLSAKLREFTTRRLGWVIAAGSSFVQSAQLFAELRQAGVKVLAEVTTRDFPVGVSNESVDGFVVKGHEAGGFVGEDSSLVLLQRWLARTTLPLYAHGGVTPDVAAACSAVGVAGCVLDCQLLLLEDVHPPRAYELLANLAGNETLAVGDSEHGEYFRVLVRPGHETARAFAAGGEGKGEEALRRMVCEDESRRCLIDWSDLRAGLLPLGQDVCFAGAWRKRYGKLAALLKAIDVAVERHLPTAAAANTVSVGAPFAKALGIGLPIVQGPMTRVSDVAAFASAVAEGGGLPMMALALLKGKPLEQLFRDTTELLGERPWGIGLLGFAPQALLDEQLEVALRFSPRYAIIAGGRPDQAVQLEKAGIPSFLHVPTAQLISLFLTEGARRFIFEGRECGGHIGPLSSFVLWSTIVDRLCAELTKSDSKVRGDEVEVVFAGGIHDAVSSAMVQVLVAPLVELGVRVGILMGSAYLFTKEIVASGAIVPTFQEEVIACEHTVKLESGPGHASRCAYTPFAREFFRAQQRLRQEGIAVDEGRKVLDDLILGRLRIASKGRTRNATDGQIETIDDARQREEGMYMLGQVVTLRSEVTDVAALHREVSEGAAALLAERLAERSALAEVAPAAEPVDIAIIGIASILPKANSTPEYWDNILERIDAITEIPAHRWDFRLYFDEDRKARDKIYSKWGGFLDDVLFDPMQYGMPPRSLESVDPMQIMALEVAQRTLVDAGYVERPFNRDRASIILGASGGTGDVGTQYGLRSELPRFTGTLPEEVAARLPEWTEDTFAGILNNVTAGRIANRLDFGGVNFTTDAACASSLAALYQGISELTAGRSDLVIAGGVDTVQGPFGYLCFSKTQALSPRGRCSSFDAAGDGIVISEGIAMVALKRLADAERDGDRIYAVIKGAGGSSDGKARGMTAPLPAGQLRAMRRAYAQAGFGPEAIGLFEAHGTGTVAGDTAELESTTALVRESGGQPHQAVIGSVKTMIGHTKATAGVAGLIKAALSLHHRVLPPHRGVDNPNAVLQKADCPLHLLSEPLPWLSRPQRPRRAAVSAFGFGGTNFHIVLEEYADEYRPWLRATPGERWPAELFVWSATNRDALVADLGRLQKAAAGSASLRALAAGLAARRRSGGETVAIVARTSDDLRTKLDAALARLAGGTAELPVGVYLGSTGTDAKHGKVAVLFPGQGSQYPGMLRELALYFPVCAETLSKADTALSREFELRFGKGRALSDFIFPRAAYSQSAKEAAATELTQTDVAQPALGAVDVAAFHLLESFGFEPDLLAGHSFGEFVALYAGGAIGFESLMALSAARGRFIVDASKAAGAELGTMAAVPADRERIETIVGGIDGVIVANHNAPEQSIISGSRAAVAAAVAKLAEQGIEATPLNVAAAFHSELVMPAKRALGEQIEATPWQPTTIPVYSNTTGAAHLSDVGETKRLMAEHLVQPVEFVDEIETMYEDGARIFVELGPKAVLSRLTDKILKGRPHLALSLDQGGVEGLLKLLGQLVCAGVELDLGKLFEQRTAPVADPFTPLPAPVAPRHAWLINGSGVRRSGEPVRQIGVTQEQLASEAHVERAAAPIAAPVSAPPAAASTPAPAPVASPAAFSPAIRASAPAQIRTNPPQPLPPRTANMSDFDERRPVPIAGDSTAISEYFETMRHFLETQERVMAMVMGAQPSARPVAALRAPTPTNGAAPRALSPLAAVPRRSDAPPPRTTIPPPPPAPIIVMPEGPPSTPAPAPTAVAASNGHAAPAAAPAPAPKAAPAAAAAAPSAAVLDRAQLTELLLGIVEEKTGYPRDMVGMTQNLESDLGIDSIKRIEVVGAMLQLLPEQQRQKLAESRGKLNTQPTLEGMLSILSSVNGSNGSPVPFDAAGAGVAVVSDHLPRYLIVSEEHELDSSALHRIRRGHFVIADDALGVAPLLAARLVERGSTVSRVSRETLANENALVDWIRGQGFAAGKVEGIVHLAALGVADLEPSATVEGFRAALELNEKSLFLLLRELNAALAEDGHALGASALGGYFGRRGKSGTGVALQGGGVGLLKSYSEERPSLRLKAVDIDPGEAAEAIARHLFEELSVVGGRQEVGYPAGRRTTFHTVETKVALANGSAPDLANLVVVATGGARGVTAEILRELAAAGNTLILTGRKPLPEADSNELAVLATAEELRRHFIAAVKSGQSKLTPGQIGRQVQAILAAREMRKNLEDFTARGAKVEYHAVDVTDETAVQALLADVVARHGAISGVVHGAGVIEDKLVADKASDSWSRVVETKVMGLLLLQKYLEPSALRFFAVMSSVAGRYGNSGQADYATANELMNRLCCQLRDRYDGRINVMALCWGPWGPTTFGAGMVTAETEAKFAQKGVHLVTAAVGRKLFIDELLRGDTSPVEIVCGVGPWEEREASVGKVEHVPLAGPARSLGALLGDARVEAQPKGDQIVSLRVDASHAYLQGHCIDGVPVLPAAAALELFAEAAASLWQGWKVVEVRDLRLMKGVELKTPGRPLRIVISPPTYGSSEGFDVNAVLQSEPEGDRPPATHYRCTLRLEQQLREEFELTPQQHSDKALTVAHAYGEWLFHGECFQVIRHIDGLSPRGALAQVRRSTPGEWLLRPTGDERWVFDPAVLDAAPQMAILWARACRDETSLPTRFGRVVRYRDVMPPTMTMAFECLASTDPNQVRANVYYLDENQRVVLMIEELECVSSAALNRLPSHQSRQQSSPWSASA